MKLKALNIATLFSLTLGTASVFAAGTFSCQGKGVKMNGTYGSVGASLKFLEIKEVAQVKEEELGDRVDVYLNRNKLLANGVLDVDKGVYFELETVGSSAENESEPWVYGGIVKTTAYKTVDEKEVKLSKAVPVSCSASY